VLEDTPLDLDVVVEKFDMVEVLILDDRASDSSLVVGVFVVSTGSGGKMTDDL
jgi:hypothetical protein